MTNQEWNALLAERYDLSEQHFWKHKQSGKWIITHIGCMIIADQEGIQFSKPEYIVAQGDCVALYGTASITATDGSKKEVWTHGEANTQNCFAPYPFAMAEKRLKDRLTLMIIAAYGEVYSEIEADEFAASRKQD